MKIIIHDIDGQAIWQGELSDLKLKESYIIKKSIEFFNNASSYFIHRSAVMTRIFAELESSIRLLTSEDELGIIGDRISQEYGDILELPAGAYNLKQLADR